jgi:hypothetical protein
LAMVVQGTIPTVSNVDKLSQQVLKPPMLCVVLSFLLNPPTSTLSLTGPQPLIIIHTYTKNIERERERENRIEKSPLEFRLNTERRKWIDKKESRSFASHHLFNCTVRSHFDDKLAFYRPARENTNKEGRWISILIMSERERERDHWWTLAAL